MEAIFNFVLQLVGHGLVFYVVNRIFSKNTKKLHVKFDQTSVEFVSEFYENQNNEES